MPRSKRFFSLVMLVVTALACAIPGAAQPDADAIGTSAAETIVAGLTQNVTETFTPGITPSLTPTFTPTLIYLTPRMPKHQVPRRCREPSQRRLRSCPLLHLRRLRSE
jgi:hypothetical protein